SVEWDSPAQRGGLMAQDQVLALDGARVSAKSMDEALKFKKAGEKVRFLVSRRGTIREMEVVLGQKVEKSFKVKPVASPTGLQAEILDNWLKQKSP
ncbi:MAG TPA: PDZ domain-containing protein, partial [Bryobacteraceae bacterium]|nr:PDZ domain-containing protein [Bryobacteraceae bacterium]